MEKKEMTIEELIEYMNTHEGEFILTVTIEERQDGK